MDYFIVLDSATENVYVNLKWIRIVGTNIIAEKNISIVRKSVMGESKPIEFANYLEVPFSKNKLPIITPDDWQDPWIILIILGLFNYFKHNASREISWRLRPKYIKIAKKAKILAYWRLVKNEQMKIIEFVKSWLIIIHVFLFP